MFNVIYLVSNGGPMGNTEILISDAYQWAILGGNYYGCAAAYAVLIFGVLLIYGRFANRLAGRRCCENTWKTQGLRGPCSAGADHHRHAVSGALGSQDGLGAVPVFLHGTLPLPSEVSLENFKAVVSTSDAQGALFPRQLWDSLIVSLATSILGVSLAATAAYAMSRWDFPGKNQAMGAFLVTQMFPGVVMAIPLYILLDQSSCSTLSPAWCWSTPRPLFRSVSGRSKATSTLSQLHWRRQPSRRVLSLDDLPKIVLPLARLHSLSWPCFPSNGME